MVISCHLLGRLRREHNCIISMIKSESPNDIICSFSTFRLNTRYQPQLFFIANLQLRLGIEQTPKQESYSRISRPILCLCWLSVCADIDAAVTMILGLITTPETDVSPPPISTGAISREQERDANDFCRQTAECQLGWLCLKQTQCSFFTTTLNMSFTVALLHSASWLLMPSSPLTLCSASVLLLFSNKHTCQMQPTLNSPVNEKLFVIKSIYSSPLTH